MKTKIEFEKIGDTLVIREGDRQRNFQVLSAQGRYVGEICETEWELNEHGLPILQNCYQSFCEKNNLQVTKDGYITFREYALYFGFKFEEETAPVFYDGNECQPGYGETVYAFYSDGSEGFARFINAETSNTPYETDYWYRIEDGTDETPVKWCSIYPYLFEGVMTSEQR